MSFLQDRLFAQLEGLTAGTVTLEGRTFGSGDLTATIEVKDPLFYRAVAFGGSIGAAEAYMEGWWTCDDLVSLFRMFVRQKDLMDGMENRWANPIRAFLHWLNRNTRKGSRSNIAAHYDLGNDFFELFLDPTLTYSSGIFPTPEATMEEASVEKLDRICRVLELSGDDHVLEIGTGWGSFARHAAANYGCKVTTTTISKQQHAIAAERTRGLDVELLLRDYRDLTGTYDKLVTIEMIEAVGHAFYPEFFACCERLLKPGGRMLMQAITINDHYYDQARKEVDFIKKYIFPGSCIPSLTALSSAAAKTTELRLVDLHDITPHYAETLRVWRERFLENRDRIAALGYKEPFLRMWEFYLAYCEGGFRERFLGDVHLVWSR